MAALAEAQQVITRDLLRAIVPLFPLLSAANGADTWPGLLRLLVARVAAAHAQAGQAAVDAYVESRRAAGVGGPPYRPEPSQLADEDLQRVRVSLTVTGPVALQRALARGETEEHAQRLALVQLQGAATRHALAGARDTTVEAAAEDPAALGWARIPKPDGCWWCLMLATRSVGPDRVLYLSGETAGRTTGRSSRGAGRRYHDHCRCEVAAVFSDDWEPPEHVLQAEELWQSSTAGRSGREARLAFAAAVREQRRGENEPAQQGDADTGPEPADLDARQQQRPAPRRAPSEPADLDDDEIDQAMQAALAADDWDRFELLAEEAERRDQERRDQEARQARRDRDRERREALRVEQEEARAAEYERLLEQGYGDEEAVERAYGVSVEQQRRESAIASLRDQGYRGASFDDLARQSYKDKLASDYWAAEDATNGYLLSREGEMQGIDPRELWTRNEAFARRWASSELREWWDQHGRVTFEVWRAQLLGDVVAAGRAQAQRGDFYT